MRPMILSLAAAASTVALTQIASAADLGQPIDKAPLPPPAPVYSWTGLYAGVNAGLGWENTINNAAIPIFCNPIDTACPAWAGSAAAAVPQKFDTHPLGFIGGGQIGYNLQFASAWVAGIEADFQGANIKGDAIVPNAEPIPSAIPGTVTNTGTGSQKLDWLGTVRGRVGWLPVNPLLLYATGGLAYGHVQTAVSFHNQTFSAFCGCFTTDGSVSASDTTTRAGWTVGGGLEWMIAPNWSLKGEYLYYDLGRVTLNSVLDQNGVPGNVLFTAVAIRSEAFFHGSIARVGLNYRFSPATDPGQQPVYEPPPPLPEPVYDRTGFYAGLNAGGGWENTINNTATTGFCNIVQTAFCDDITAGVPGQLDTHPHGFIGGGQIGYNSQLAPAWVVGIEADFQGTNIKGDASGANTLVVAGFPDNPVTVSGTGSQKIDWFGTLRGRVGWAPVNPLLVYATGGLAYGRVETDVSFASHIPSVVFGNVAGATAVSDDDTRAGWTIGGGLEWMFAPQWSIKGEYLYYDLGTVSIDQRLVTSGAGILAHMANIHSEAHYHGNIARVGVNYKFY